MSTESATPVHVHETIPLAADPLAAPATPVAAPAEDKPRNYRVALRDCPTLVVSALDRDAAREAYFKINGVIETRNKVEISLTSDPVTDLDWLRLSATNVASLTPTIEPLQSPKWKGKPVPSAQAYVSDEPFGIDGISRF